MAAITPRQRTGWATANFVVIALALIPVLWLVSLSFKTPTAVLDPSFIPSQWTWGNYHGILTSSQFLRPLLNSIGIGLISTLIAVVLASMAAYAVARLRFPGKSVLIGMALLIASSLPGVCGGGDGSRMGRPASVCRGGGGRASAARGRHSAEALSLACGLNSLV